MRNAISLLIMAAAIAVGMQYGFWYGVVAFLVFAAGREIVDGGKHE